MSDNPYEVTTGRRDICEITSRPHWSGMAFGLLGVAIGFLFGGVVKILVIAISGWWVYFFLWLAFKPFRIRVDANFVEILQARIRYRTPRENVTSVIGNRGLIFFQYRDVDQVEIEPEERATSFRKTLTKTKHGHNQWLGLFAPSQIEEVREALGLT